MVVTSLRSPFIPIEAALVYDIVSTGGETGVGNSDFLHEYKGKKYKIKNFVRFQVCFLKYKHKKSTGERIAFTEANTFIFPMPLNLTSIRKPVESIAFIKPTEIGKTPAIFSNTNICIHRVILQILGDTFLHQVCTGLSTVFPGYPPSIFLKCQHYKIKKIS